ncbi:MAG: hypothetical protein UU88_C0001G0119 [Parcubacteria group bacterium GW2011_GWC1_42_11]|nr:MAG: hypothetical protein UU88_C0001G0119 [Parcubacteria group bacterium GW2011_GWC1_42_11]KKS57757.1 MAG: hypothetical protein UV24_C0039G0004 [Candidatus Nomurabacteria bacterium GW2011_GWA2_42_41]TAN35911.1 MAG: hypothetical protein EPN27_02655 [Patescibacteria group bacterium]HBH71613.1 hypothetical protein [Candidatus Yonathbacteria bacterium]
MKTNTIADVTHCNNCDGVIQISQTSLVLAQGLMMPIVPKYEGVDGRFGFSIILHVCPACDKNLLSENERVRKDYFLRAPFSKDFALEDLDIIRAGFDTQNGYYAQRRTRFPARVAFSSFECDGLYIRSPRFIVREEEKVYVHPRVYLDIKETNIYVF